MMNPMLEVANVTKYFRHNWTYRRIPAVENLSLQVEAGEVYGLIGHNGAGKTTTFKMLVGLLRPSSGHLSLCGRSLDDPNTRALLGFAPEQPYFYDCLTVSETLKFYAQLYGLHRSESTQRIAALVERFRLGAKLAAPMRTLSKGNLQRVAVLQAILHNPKLAILDEPMSGLDPAGRKEMRDLIKSLKQQGTAVLFSSHVLSDAEMLCDRVAILKQGRLCEVVRVSDPQSAPTTYTLTLLDPPADLLAQLERHSPERVDGSRSRWSVRLSDQASVYEALAAARRCNATIEALTPLRPNLEERFLQYVPTGSEE